MDISKLLWLALVILLEQNVHAVTSDDCTGSGSNTVCKGVSGKALTMKLGENIKEGSFALTRGTATVANSRYVATKATDELKINDLVASDSGKYKASYTKHDTQDEVKEEEFQVQIDVECKDQVKCMGVKDTDLTFMLKGKAVEDTFVLKLGTDTVDTTRYTIDDTGSETKVKITGLKTSDSGDYVATYKVAEETKTETFNVLLFVECTVAGDCECVKGGTVRLESGDQDATWAFNGNALTTDNRIKANEGYVEIKDLTTSDAGSYIASKSSSPVKTFKIKIFVPKKVSTGGDGNLHKGVSGSDLTLTLAHKVKTGTPVELKRGTATVKKLRTTTSSSDPTKTELTIALLEARDSGKYKATYMKDNDTPQKEDFEVQVDVECKDKVPCMGVKGADLTFMLEGKAEQATFVLKHGTDKVATTRYTIDDADSSKTKVKITGLKTSDSGEYVATYQKGQDKTEEKFTVLLFVVCKDDGKCECKGGGTVRLESGHQDATWNFNSKALPTNNRIEAQYGDLEISKLTTADGGQYQATKTGEAQPLKDIKLKVLGGGAGVLAYSPGLLVMVTLMHLLLQLVG